LWRDLLNWGCQCINEGAMMYFAKKIVTTMPVSHSSTLYSGLLPISVAMLRFYSVLG
jgi:hypothetical protein